MHPRGVHMAAGERATSAVHMADKQCSTPSAERQLSHAQLMCQPERASAVVEDAWQQCSGRPSGVGCQRRSGVRRQSANVRWQVGILNLFPTSTLSKEPPLHLLRSVSPAQLKDARRRTPEGRSVREN
ncbi:hypothetical protein LR48_Vigan10g106200 [Vigna angularis]|uniref:Uncharacterized protein n=1 Tax=Phaseolus angularis TaxID=3914 RepID=A0A0L9VJE4_PHAAN|nr:hypothetical protein LR48_Vigan10g106200 [Vigna angularis]